MSKTIQKERIIRQLERLNLNPSLALRKISSECDDNTKNDVKKRVFMHVLWNAFLMTISFYLS